MATRFQHPAVADISLDMVLAALSDPVRRAILSKLVDSDGLCCSAACSDLAPSTISFHHRVLREAGLIRSEKQGVKVVNTARTDEIEQRFPGLLDTIFRCE